MTPPGTLAPAALRLLIVEDEALLAMDLKDMAEELGHEVVAVAGDVDTALRAIEDDAMRPQAAVLDATLNGRAADPVADLLRRRGIPFVLATGQDAGRMKDAGYLEPVLAKPFDLTQLEEALAALAAAVRRS